VQNGGERMLNSEPVMVAEKTGNIVFILFDEDTRVKGVFSSLLAVETYLANMDSNLSLQPALSPEELAYVGGLQMYDVLEDGEKFDDNMYVEQYNVQD
jgi:hypothetical protein